MKRFLLYMAIFGSYPAIGQEATQPCCTVIDLQKEAGTFTIRDRNTGRIQVFKPEALEGAELQVGDTVHADFASKKIISVKGELRNYDLLEASQLDSCCIVMKIDTLRDSTIHVTAKNNATGEKIRFNLPQILVPRLAEGSMVFTQPSHGYAMIAVALADTTQRALYGFPLLQETAKESK